MLKAKYKIFLIYALIILVNVLMANAGYCDEANKEVNKALTKFLMAMGGVVLSSLILFAGLTAYNRFFVNRKGGASSEDSLATPQNIDDATAFFIKRNKLQ